MYRIYFLAYWALVANAEFDLKLPKIEPADDYNNELKLQTAINTELTQYRAKLNHDVGVYENYNTINVSSFHLGVDSSSSESHEMSDKRHATNPTASADNATNNEKNTGGEGTLNGSKDNPNTGDIYSSAGQCLKEAEKNDCNKFSTNSSANAMDKFCNGNSKPHMQKSNESILHKENRQGSIFLGTNLFDLILENPCFSLEDMAFLSMRQHFEDLIPKNFSGKLLSNQQVCVLMRYFYNINEILQQYDHNIALQHIMELSFYDSMGAYLYYYLLPAAKISFYAGEMKLCTMQRLMKLYENCLIELNTNGDGWALPDSHALTDEPRSDIKPLTFELCKGPKFVGCCAVLDFEVVEKEPMKQELYVELPVLEPVEFDGSLSNIRLPFRKRRIYDIRSEKNMLILLKFYKILTYCHQFQDLSQDSYNKKFKKWIVRKVQPHLNDDVLYPGLAGVLRIYETLKNKTATNKNDSANYTDHELYGISQHPDFELFNGNQFASSYAESRKPSRSINFTQASSKDQFNHTQSHKAEKFSADGHKKKKSGELADFEDSRVLITYIGIFLGLLFVMLFFIICCGVCRKRRKKAGKEEEYQQTSSSDEEILPGEQCIEENRGDKTRCLGLCRSRKNARQRLNKQKVANTSKDNKPMQTGFAAVANLQNLQTNLPTHPLHVQAQDTKPKEPSSKFDDLALTSTSSLGFQPKRKIFPISKILKTKSNLRNTTSASANGIRIQRKTYNKMTPKLVTINENPLVLRDYSSEEKSVPLEVCRESNSKSKSIKKTLGIGTKNPPHLHTVPSTNNYYYSSSEIDKHSSGRIVQNGSNAGSSWKTTFTTSS